ncbi:hypothetical protein [Gimesia sp.]|uniref:hypothetical protein n=1 Tax=Gimesia sp. TaxID=2024833 RepID=UPI003A94A901
MKRIALSLMIITMVFSTSLLDVEAGNRGRSGGSKRSGGSSFSRSSRSNNFSSRSRTQSRAPRMQSSQRSTRNFSNVRKTPTTTNRKPTSRTIRDHRTPTTRNIRDHRTGNTKFTRDHRQMNVRPKTVNSAPRPRQTFKPIDSGIGNGKPTGGGFNRPTKKPFTGIRPRPANGSAPKPRPSIKPIDPGIGNGRPGNGGIRPRPGNGAPKPRPSIKPIDPGIGNGRPGLGGIRPRPGNGAPKPRPNPKPPVGNGPPKPRPPKPNPGQGHNGHGNNGGGHHGGHHNGGHHNGHHNGNHGHHWHNHRPRFSWWWFNYCTPLQNCRVDNYQYCNYVYPTCDYVAPNGQIVEDVRWYLGMKGLMLPGKGIGIESVEANSPADLTGLKPGMVITKCNDVVITDDTTFGQVIAESGGVLELELLESVDGPQLEATVQMTRLPTANF